MATVRFQDLIVYQLAEQLSDEVWKIVKSWDWLAQDTVGKQLVRAADSVGANIAEGAGRYSYQDNRRFIRIARGSLYETQHWLRRAYQRKFLGADKVKLLKSLLDTLAPKLNAYLRSINKKCDPNNPSNNQQRRTSNQK